MIRWRRKLSFWGKHWRIGTFWYICCETTKAYFLVDFCYRDSTKWAKMTPNGVIWAKSSNTDNRSAIPPIKSVPPITRIWRLTMARFQLRPQRWSIFQGDGMVNAFFKSTIAVNGFSMVLTKMDHHHWMFLGGSNHWNQWFFDGFQNFEGNGQQWSILPFVVYF